MVSPQLFSIPLVAITGARPGVGTTTVAANLAAVLADLGERVVLVDAADEHTNLAQVAGVSITNVQPRSVSIPGSRNGGESLIRGPAGTMILSAQERFSAPGRQSRRESPAGDFSRHAQQRLLGKLQSLDQIASAIVVDTGTGYTPWIQRFWLRAKLVLLVITTDDAAVMDAYATIKRSASTGIAADIRVLAAQCESEAKARAAYGRLSSACRRFLSRELATLPPLPVQVAECTREDRAGPRVWNSPNSPFGHAALWLGKAVSDVLAKSVLAANPLPGGRACPRPEFSSC
jgi:flagellar biosynthesis protein FlhG